METISPLTFLLFVYIYSICFNVFHTLIQSCNVFWVSFILSNIVSSRFIHVMAKGKISLLKAGCHSIIYIPQFLCSAFHRHLGCFHFLTLLYNAVVNMGMQGHLLGVAIILITYAEDRFVIGIHAFIQSELSHWLFTTVVPVSIFTWISPYIPFPKSRTEIHGDKLLSQPDYFSQPKHFFSKYLSFLLPSLGGS